MDIFEHIKLHFENKLPFVAYKKPNDYFIHGIFQKNDTLFYLEKYTEVGFVFSPFDNKKKTVIIPLKHSKTLKEYLKINIPLNPKKGYNSIELLKDQHIDLIKKGLEEIRKKNLKKIVLSRKETINCKDFNIIITFKKLLKTYPNTMVYIWYHPKVGLWLGATPEILLKIANNTFETMALAGTQSYNGNTNVLWHQKERDEQQFVTDYLVNKLSKISKNIKKSKTQTIKAGSVLHLKTRIYGTVNSNNFNLKSLLKTLHPTPAVCGLPKKKSKQFIVQNEQYDRSFYTGFLGEINFESQNKKSMLKQSELFVNLRCMEVHSNLVSIFVGGGITKDSNPEKEWEETVAKSNIIKQGLH